jgi:phosphoribosylformylglycinamidine synthase
MAMASGIGAVLQPSATTNGHEFWFGEDQGRYVVTAKNVDPIIHRAEEAGVPLYRLGATGGKVLAVPGQRPLPVGELKARFETWLPSYMAAPA